MNKYKIKVCAIQSVLIITKYSSCACLETGDTDKNRNENPKCSPKAKGKENKGRIEKKERKRKKKKRKRKRSNKGMNDQPPKTKKLKKSNQKSATQSTQIQLINNEAGNETECNYSSQTAAECITTGINDAYIQ